MRRRMGQTADTYAIGKVFYEMVAGRDDNRFPELPRAVINTGRKWDPYKIADCITRACSPRAEDRYPSATAMLEDLEACADFPFGTLFEELPPEEPAPVRPLRRADPIAAAVIHTLPWILGLIALIIVVLKYG